ncbi:uncharacterized protein K452DRAFT_308186 [Aplosporella prunicola CBS 121167]|uniref:[acyl-carrier-protein] S-malonyltransferase n=1 Tax=Aplosporella prunicola CBS 121167 TaxID=1176127 RepID=A0A6A6BJ08_9PEZI|nr:uncharacterized protein K452DRAFT_308186 [Aplosporella prunicola CBS 121167]KAF2142531.1 hypothetical protein K452DRAFT_308186 [Aplosporella prunicola CBS 121167]
MSPVPRAGFTAVNGRESPAAPKPNGAPTSPSEGHPYPPEPRPLSPAKRKRSLLDDDPDTPFPYGPRRRFAPDSPDSESDDASPPTGAPGQHHADNSKDREPSHPEPEHVDSPPRHLPPGHGNDDDGPDDDAARPADGFDITRAGVQVNLKKNRKRAFANRTKTGCQTCRRRKKKCDEKKPECNNCIRGGFVCEGYLTKSTWTRPGMTNHFYLQSKLDYPDYLGLYLRQNHEALPESRSQQPMNGARAAAIIEEERNQANLQSAWRLTAQETARPPFAQPHAFSNEAFRASRPLESALNARLDFINPVRTDQPTSSRPISPNHEMHGTEKTQATVGPQLPLHHHLSSTQPAQLTSSVQLPQSASYTRPAQPPQPPQPQPPQTAPTTQIALPTPILQPTPPAPPSEMAPPVQPAPTLRPGYTVLPPQPLAEKQIMRKALRDFNDAEADGFSPEEQRSMLRAILDPPSTRPPNAPARGYLGKDVCVDAPFSCQYGYNLSIGDEVTIAQKCTIVDPVAVTIGARCVIGPNVSIYAGTASTNMRDRKGVHGAVYGCAVKIEEGVFVGGAAVILPGVTIGRGSTVGAASVVTKVGDAREHHGEPGGRVVEGPCAARPTASAKQPSRLPPRFGFRSRVTSPPTTTLTTSIPSTTTPQPWPPHARGSPAACAHAPPSSFPVTSLRLACCMPSVHPASAGQGVQRVAMATPWLEAFPRTVKPILDEIDSTLNLSLARLIAHGPSSTLTATENAQPAIMATSVLILRTLESEFGFKPHERCDFTLGHSLGEFAALVAGGYLSFADALRLVRRRAEVMARCAKKASHTIGGGEVGMEALVCENEEHMHALVSGVREFLGHSSPGAKQDSAYDVPAVQQVSIANINSKNQIVLSGSIERIRTLLAHLRQFGGHDPRAVRLKADSPFHSPLMKPAEKEMRRILDTPSKSTGEDIISWPGTISCISNVTARPFRTQVELKDLLARQCVETVDWWGSVRYLDKEEKVRRWIGIGPGKVGRNLVGKEVGMKGPVKGGGVWGIEDPRQVEELMRALEETEKAEEHEEND